MTTRQVVPASTWYPARRRVADLVPGDEVFLGGSLGYAEVTAVGVIISNGNLTIHTTSGPVRWAAGDTCSVKLAP